MTRRFCDAVLSLSEYNRFSKGLFGWVGFKTIWLDYENVERAAGKTKFSFFGLFAYAIDGIVSFSTKPLIAASITGIFSCFFALVFVIILIIRRLVFGDPVTGWASTACIIIFMGGLQFLGIGIIGEYLAKIFTESKRRPSFIIKDSDIT